MDGHRRGLDRLGRLADDGQVPRAVGPMAGLITPPQPSFPISRPINPATGLPAGLTYNSTGPYGLAPNVRFEVYQGLSTRAGGEVISADAY